MASVESKIPQEMGISFGSCYTSCGSIGITAVDMSSFNLDDDPMQIRTSFTTCNNTDLAVLIVPIEITLGCTLALRATGIGHTWPTPEIGDDGVVHQHDINVTGNILVSIPVSGNTFEFTKVRTDVMFSGNWSSASWPDTTNILYNTIPINELCAKYMRSFNSNIRKDLSLKIRHELQSADIVNTCTFPSIVLAECNVNTRTSTEFCNPCDTCCMCLMQQRCDGECASCECVQCEDTKWFATMFLITLFFFIVSGTIVWSLLNT